MATIDRESGNSNAMEGGFVWEQQTLTKKKKSKNKFIV